MVKTASFYFCFFFLLISKLAFGQQVFTIKSKLVDATTSQPIPFASIYLKNTSIGTTSNTDGYFVFHIPERYKSNFGVISAIGYASITNRPNTFIENGRILLSPKINKLDEVLVTASKDKVLSAKEIVRRAYKNIENNYPDEPYILEGFLRDLQKEDSTYVEYLECAARFNYSSTQVKQEPKMEILGVRSNTIAVKHALNKIYERKNSLIDLVEDDFIRFNYGPILAKKGWKYRIEDVVAYDNRLVYKIIGIEKPFQTTTLFIDTETFAFVRMKLTRKALKNRSCRKRLSNGALQVYYNVIFEYQEYKGKMYLKYQMEEDHWQIFDGLESKNVLFTKYPKKELFINKIITKNIETYPFTRNLDINTSIENHAEVYDTSFWTTYNIPKRTIEQSKILKELKEK